MANLGNCWHIPANPQPRGRAGMRDPVGPPPAGSAVTVFSGNQDTGPGGNPGNQDQVGSSVFFKRPADAAWTEAPMAFQSAAGNDKFYAATIPGTFKAGEVVQYYLRIAYSDHDTTFLLANGAVSATSAAEGDARATPFTFTVGDPAVLGQWGPVFPLPNVGIHAHVLPTGKVLLWGRRSQPGASLDEHVCTPFLWDPATGATTPAPQPKLADGTTVNLFCSGHTFLKDGRLLVVGGHLFDTQGLTQACIYDSVANTWTPTAVMNNGRWYPTATTLADGSVLVTSGSFLAGAGAAPNPIPQVWQDGAWTPIVKLPDEVAGSFTLFPRMHVLSTGRLFMPGPQAVSWFLDIAGGGTWTQAPSRTQGQRDYAPSVLYDTDKVIFIGGGNPPSAVAETIDLSAAAPAWRPTTQPMHTGRRQHNATLLPDGTVLVTGGTRGNGGPNNGFDDLGPGEPVHVAELWDPATGTWTALAAEQVDRCYHGTAVLLADGRVLSAGGGEFRPLNNVPDANDPLDSHRDAQVFSPPYLFKGPRPVIASAPAAVDHGAAFVAATPDAASIAKVTLLRLSSVTHSFNMNQRINVLAFAQSGAGLSVTAPATPALCPPGHYLLFLVNKAGVPSVGHVLDVQWSPAAQAAAPAAAAPPVAAPAADVPQPPDLFALQAAVRSQAPGPSVLVGLLGTCPYGIGACWGGAHEALATLTGVDSVDPIPDAQNSTAEVFLVDDQLPDLGAWADEFRQVVNESYHLRGFEMTLTGTLAFQAGGFGLAAAGQRPAVQLVPLVPADKVQWDPAQGAPRPVEPAEAAAFASLTPLAGQTVTVTGPLQQTPAGYRLEVRAVTAG